MENNILVITSKEFKCTHCKKEIKDIQRALWVYRMCEHFRYNDAISIQVTKMNMPHAELPISILKDAFMLEETDRRIIETKSKNTSKPIKAVEIILEKIPAIKR